MPMEKLYRDAKIFELCELFVVSIVADHTHRRGNVSDPASDYFSSPPFYLPRLKDT
jgi:hypothetical protein